MKIVGQLVLAPGLSFIPVGDLPETVRDRLNGSGYAVTRPTGRVSSTLLDDDATQLLREFAAPTTIVEAVLRFSRRRTLDPEQVLDASYPVLRRCLDNGFLIEAGSPGSAGPTTAFAIGERVAGGIVVRCVHALEDGEIYQ